MLDSASSVTTLVTTQPLTDGASLHYCQSHDGSICSGGGAAHHNPLPDWLFRRHLDLTRTLNHRDLVLICRTVLVVMSCFSLLPVLHFVVDNRDSAWKISDTTPSQQSCTEVQCIVRFPLSPVRAWNDSLLLFLLLLLSGRGVRTTLQVPLQHIYLARHELNLTLYG